MCHEVALEFFTTKAPNPPHWTLNSCSGAFCTILVHLRPFGCLAKLEAKHSKQVQKFVPQSRVGIFCNEHIRCTPFDPKHMFWCVSYHCDAFGTVRLPYETRSKNLCHEVALEFFTTKAPDPSHWTLNSCFGAFHTIWVHLEPLGCLTKLSAKQAELVQKFVP